MKKLNDKNFGVTGGTIGGIGFATLQLLVELGANVLFSCTSEKNVKAAKKSLEEQKALINSPSIIEGVVVDVRDPEDIQNFYDVFSKKFSGSLDYLFSNAGIAGFSFMADPDYMERFEDIININLIGNIRTVKEGLPYFAKDVSILFNSSMASTVGFKGISHYCASKAGLDGAMRALAMEYGTEGWRVNSIQPGLILTPIYDKASENISPEQMKEIQEYLVGRIALARPGMPEEIAETAVAVLVHMTYTTGSEIPACAGVDINT